MDSTREFDPPTGARSRAWLAGGAVAILIAALLPLGVALARPAPKMRPVSVRIAAVPTVRRHAVPLVRRHAPARVRRHADPKIARDRALAAGMRAAAAIARYAGGVWVAQHPEVRRHAVPLVRRHVPAWVPPAGLPLDGYWSSAPDWALWRCTAMHESDLRTGSHWTFHNGPFEGAFAEAHTTYLAVASGISLPDPNDPTHKATVLMSVLYPHMNQAPPEVQLEEARVARGRFTSSQWGGLRACGG